MISIVAPSETFLHTTNVISDLEMMQIKVKLTVAHAANTMYIGKLILSQEFGKFEKPFQGSRSPLKQENKERLSVPTRYIFK